MHYVKVPIGSVITGGGKCIGRKKKGAKNLTKKEAKTGDSHNIQIWLFVFCAFYCAHFYRAYFLGKSMLNSNNVYYLRCFLVHQTNFEIKGLV
jgi:hypothetical protein